MVDQTNGVKGTVFYLDLDCVIIGNIDHLIYEDKQFYVCHDFNRTRIPNTKMINSSVMQWTVSDKTHKIWKQWIGNYEKYIKTYRGDQDYLDRECRWNNFRFNNSQAIVSYKWEACGNKHNNLQQMNTTPTVLPEHRIYVFHGRPNPDEINEDVIVQNWI